MDPMTDEQSRLVNEFLASPLLARMATADITGQPHVVPVWYAWDGECLWISAFADTRKVRDLRENPRLSVAIDETRADGVTTAVIMEGTVELLTEPKDLLLHHFTWIYARYVGEDGVKEKTYQDWINDPLNTLIKLKPAWVKTWRW